MEESVKTTEMTERNMTMDLTQKEQPQTLQELAQYAFQALQMPDYDVRAYSPLTLAFLGDAVYELIIRTMVVTRANTNPNLLNKQSSNLVKAATQAEMMHLLVDHLTEEERAVYRRGRNAHSATKAKNATVTDYRTATGFEALMGYLYLQGKLTRIIDLVQMGLEERAKLQSEKASK